MTAPFPTTPPEPFPIGVFTSVDAGLGVRLDVAKELNIPTVQLHAPDPAGRDEAAAARFLAELSEAGIRLTCVFAGFEGESYASIAEAARTVGLVPRDRREARAAELCAISDYAETLRCGAVGLHVGFVPHDRGGEDYKDLVATVARCCDHAAENGQTINLETGQETAAALLEFLGDVGRENLGVNFDPANLLLYGTGDPLADLRTIGGRVFSVHCKDARRAAPDVRGEEWGEEVPLGEGEVDIPAYVRTLHELGYRGPLTIERELPDDPERQKKDVAQAVAVLEAARAGVLGA